MNLDLFDSRACVLKLPSLCSYQDKNSPESWEETALWADWTQAPKWLKPASCQSDEVHWGHPLLQRRPTIFTVRVYICFQWPTTYFKKKLECLLFQQLEQVPKMRLYSGIWWVVPKMSGLSTDYEALGTSTIF